MNKTNKMTALAVNTAMVPVLGAGAGALLLPSIASSAGRQSGQGARHTLGHFRHSSADNTVSPAKHGADHAIRSP